MELKKLNTLTAIKTPYDESGRFDFHALDVLMEAQIEGGVEGIIVGGTTGEGHLMSWPCHVMLIAHCSKHFGDRIKIVGNVGSNNTGEAVYASQQGFAVGMDAALHINPYYGKTSEQGVIRHLEEAMEHGPTFLYNVPGRTGQDIEPHIVEKFADHPHLVGVKECMGFDRIAHYAKKNILCWSGNDDDSFNTRHNAGGQGVISVTANIVPGVMSKLMHGPIDEELHGHVKELMGWLFTEPNPICVNVNDDGSVQTVFRLRIFLALRTSYHKEILEKIGLENLPAGVTEIRVMEDLDFIVECIKNDAHVHKTINFATHHHHHRITEKSLKVSLESRA